MSKFITVGQKNKRLAMVWLFLAAVMAVLWLGLVLTTKAPHLEEQKSVESVHTPDLPTTITFFNQFSKEIPAIGDEVISAQCSTNLSHHYKDKKYFSNGAKRWTVQIMDVGQRQVVTDYLKHHQGDEGFAYFCYYRDGEARYVLTYGMTSDKVQAQRLIDKSKKLADKEFVEYLQIKPIPIRQYLEWMKGNLIDEDSEIQEVKKVPSVKLVPTQTMTPAEPVAQEVQEQLPVTKKTELIPSEPKEYNKNRQESKEVESHTGIGNANSSKKADATIAHESVVAPTTAPEHRELAPIVPSTPVFEPTISYGTQPTVVTPNTNTNSVPGSITE